MKVQIKVYNDNLNKYLSQETLTNFLVNDIEYTINKLLFLNYRITRLETSRDSYQFRLNTSILRLIQKNKNL